MADEAARLQAARSSMLPAADPLLEGVAVLGPRLPEVTLSRSGSDPSGLECPPPCFPC
jgi:hypothetical protein